jgi:putative lipoprotein
MKVFRGLVLSLPLLGACATAGLVPAGGGEGAARVTGTVTYRERIALPQAAIVKVQLVDVSRADAPAVVLGEQTIEARGRQPPIPFAIAYDPATIEASHVYAVQARIEDGGKLRFINDQRYAVITRGAPSEVEIVVKSIGGASPR